ncbi:MAG: nickel-dependent hydrogenase large subunit [Alphaproteobacteria bacterium]
MATIQTPNGYTLDDSGERIVVDPITRIEGHLRIEVNVDEENRIRNAVSSGTMWRGIEIILQGRDPRDAWAFCERICGVCTDVHALASLRAVEAALGITIPENANIIRNIMHLTQFAQDHLIHFYHLHALDWVDIVNALEADPAETSTLAQSLSPWPKSSPGYFRDIQAKLKRFVESGQIGPFTNGYWGHPGYKLPAEANLMAVAHYLEALDFQKDIVKIHAIFGGKNPHPHWIVGGVPCPIVVDDIGSQGVINMERLNLVKQIAQDTVEFIDQVYIPDLLAIASFYKDWAKIGGGLSSRNVMSYGEFPKTANDYSPENLEMPRGAIVDGKLQDVQDVDLLDPDEVKEWVTHSWYSYPDESKGLHPFEGITQPNFDLGNARGTRTNIEQLDEAQKYSFLKAPRWRGHPMEVGPLARYIVGYAQGHPEFKEPVDMVLKHLDLPLEAIFSTLGRTAARGLEGSWSAHKLVHYVDRLIENVKNGQVATANTELWEPESWPKRASGIGFVEAPRGALGHWATIEDKKVKAYQVVVPSTWNASPRDAAGNVGPYEAALLDNTQIADPEQPLEILRTIHSFDPCLACATHVLSEDDETLSIVRVR